MGRSPEFLLLNLETIYPSEHPRQPAAGAEHDGHDLDHDDVVPDRLLFERDPPAANRRDLDEDDVAGDDDAAVVGVG